MATNVDKVLAKVKQTEIIRKSPLYDEGAYFYI